MASAHKTLDESAVRAVVEDVLRRLQPGGNGSPAPAATSASNGRPTGGASTGRAAKRPSRPGVFADAGDAAAAAREGFEALRKGGFAARAKVIEIVQGLCAANDKEWGRIEFEETRIGRLEHKIEKLQLIKLVPGIEWLRPLAMRGDNGMTFEEYAPFGVVGGITPVTHSVPTLAGNVINIVAAGNAVVFNPHPNGARCAATAVEVMNRAIERELGIRNLICTVESPSLDSFNALCASPDVGILCITGGPGVVQAAMKSGKRAICAGPGNPPVLVDETADIAKAARDTIQGGGYDNNLLCIGEKSVFVVDKAWDPFIAALKAAGAVQLNNSQVEKLTSQVFTFKKDGGGCSHPVLERELVGKDASVLAERAGARAPKDCPMLFAETDANHLFVVEEQMMPMLPVVRVRSVEEGIAACKTAEHGYRHSAIIHSLNTLTQARMAAVMDTTLFVKNGPSVAGLGLGGEGYISFSIATTTGEGITTPLTFTRTRRHVSVESLL